MDQCLGTLQEETYLSGLPGSALCPPWFGPESRWGEMGNPRGLIQSSAIRLKKDLVGDAVSAHDTPAFVASGGVEADTAAIVEVDAP